MRLFKQIGAIVTYHRGGKIMVLDWDKLIAIAQGEYNRHLQNIISRSFIYVGVKHLGDNLCRKP